MCVCVCVCVCLANIHKFIIKSETCEICLTEEKASILNNKYLFFNIFSFFVRASILVT